jgi:N-formylglutamate deformylase
MIIPGDGRSPVLLHVPHAGTLVPSWMRPHLLLDDAGRNVHAAREPELVAALVDAATPRQA